MKVKTGSAGQPMLKYLHSFCQDCHEMYGPQKILKYPFDFGDLPTSPHRKILICIVIPQMFLITHHHIKMCLKLNIFSSISIKKNKIFCISKQKLGNLESSSRFWEPHLNEGVALGRKTNHGYKPPEAVNGRYVVVF